MQMVKESLDEGYCDISGRAGDLDLIGMLDKQSSLRCANCPVGEMGNIKIFASQGKSMPLLMSLVSSYLYRHPAVYDDNDLEA